jgi:hypothetical protein
MKFCKHCGDLVREQMIFWYCHKNGYQSCKWHDEEWRFNICLDCGIEVLLGQIPEIFIRPQFGGGRYGPLEDQSPWQEMAVRSLEDM